MPQADIARGVVPQHRSNYANRTSSRKVEGIGAQVIPGVDMRAGAGIGMGVDAVSCGWWWVRGGGSRCV